MLLKARRVSGSLAPLRRKCDKTALLSYVCPESKSITGSRNMVRVMGHMSTSGSASRSASGASGRSPGALVERRVRTPELAFPDAGCDTADVLRRFEGAIERTPGVAASPALGTLRNIEIRSAVPRSHSHRLVPVFHLPVPFTGGARAIPLSGFKVQARLTRRDGR